MTRCAPAFTRSGSPKTRNARPAEELSGA
jgi:hypothetical protein